MNNKTKSTPDGAGERTVASPSSIKVFLIDDHPFFRRGIAQLLAMTDEFFVVGEASSGPVGVTTVLGLPAGQTPDLILLDLNMKGQDGIDTLRQFRAHEVDARVLMLTVSDNPDDLMNAIRAGADGYLLKDMEPEDILQSMRDAMFGQTVIGARLAGRLAAALREESLATARNDVNLTEREQQIVDCVSQGKSNKLIARDLQIAEGTVKVHMKSLLKKLKLHSRLEVAVWAMNRTTEKAGNR